MFGDQEVTRLTYQEAVHNAWLLAGTFALSRLAGAGQSLGLSLVLPYLDEVPMAPASGATMFNVLQGFLGGTRGLLSSSNVFVSNLKGAGQYERVGPAINQGLVAATLAGLAVTGVFYFSQSWLLWFGAQQQIAKNTGNFLQVAAYGVLPMNYAFVDQLSLLAMGYKNPAMALNAFYSVSSLAIGIPLALHSKKGLEYLALGLTIGAYLTWFVGRAYMYLKKDGGERIKDKYDLFSLSLESGSSACQWLKIALPTMAQALSEWLPTLLISILISSMAQSGSQYADAQEPSMQLLIVLNQILMGLGTAATTMVATLIGQGDAQKTMEAKQIVKSNILTQVHANFKVTLCCVLPFGCLLLSMPHPFTRLFTTNKEAYDLSDTLVRYTGGSFVFDGLRNVMTGHILGKKKMTDNIYSSTSNVCITTILGVGAGWLLSSKPNEGPENYFLTRGLSIVLAHISLSFWWYKGVKEDALLKKEEQQALVGA